MGALPASQFSVKGPENGDVLEIRGRVFLTGSSFFPQPAGKGIGLWLE